jgi:hypothetical protein
VYFVLVSIFGLSRSGVSFSYGIGDRIVPLELDGKKDNTKGNGTQAVALKLIEELPGKGCYLWMDNSFTSKAFLEVLRKRGNGGTPRARPIVEYYSNTLI